MTQFVGIGGKKKAKKRQKSAFSVNPWHERVYETFKAKKGKKSRFFFIFQLLRYKKKYVRIKPKIVIFFAFLPFFIIIYTTKPYISMFLALSLLHFIRLFFAFFLPFLPFEPCKPFRINGLHVSLFFAFFFAFFSFFCLFWTKRKRRRGRRQMVVAKKWKKAKKTKKAKKK